MKPFTHDYYKYFIDQLQKNYTFIDFDEGKKLSKTEDNSLSHIILRHDIDMDLQAAYLLSQIEKDFGISSTYFVMLRCPLYNPFDSQNTDYVNGIIENGHNIGLHFDCALYDQISNDNLEQYIEKEKLLLESFFTATIKTISFHRPGKLVLDNLTLKHYTNTYESIFLSFFSYYSDSRSRWARGNPLESDDFIKNKNLHLLLHPVWWNNEFITPYDRLLKIVTSNRNKTESFLENNCSVWKESNPTV